MTGTSNALSNSSTLKIRKIKQKKKKSKNIHRVERNITVRSNSNFASFRQIHNSMDNNARDTLRYRNFLQYRKSQLTLKHKRQYSFTVSHTLSKYQNFNLPEQVVVMPTKERLGSIFFPYNEKACSSFKTQTSCNSSKLEIDFTTSNLFRS